MDTPYAITLCRRPMLDNPQPPVHSEPVEGPLPSKQHAAPSQPDHPELVEGPFPSEDAAAQTLDSE